MLKNCKFLSSVTLVPSKSKIISEGGEAVVFVEKFGNKEYAVRVQAFEPFLLTDDLKAAELKWTTHLISGRIIFFNSDFLNFTKISKKQQQAKKMISDLSQSMIISSATL